MRPYLPLSYVLAVLALLPAGCNGDLTATQNDDGGPGSRQGGDGGSDEVTPGDGQSDAERPDGSDAGTLDAPIADTAVDTAVDDVVANASCLPPQNDAATSTIGGSFRILSVTEAGPDAGTTPCGAPWMSVKVEFLPNDVPCPSGPVIVDALDFAGVGLSKPCSDLLGLQVGGVYSHAELVREFGRLYVEDYTPSMGDYDLCYYYGAQCRPPSDAGGD
jgi:hypothetical protein